MKAVDDVMGSAEEDKLGGQIDGWIGGWIGGQIDG